MKLNLGCGTQQRKGFTNVDNYVDGKKGYKFVKADIRKLPFEDNSVEYIEMMSVLEHISFREVMKTLDEIYRVLKPRDRLVLLTENFDGIAMDWIRMRMEPHDTMEYIRVMETIYGNQENEGEFHKTAFTPDFLRSCLIDAGFRGVGVAVHPKGSPIPRFGTVPAKPNMVLRSDQLLATAIK